MKLAKSLLLGSAAGLVAVTGAQAADLPVRAAAPVDYVRTCPNAPIGGTGFFVIPGTETCLQISGYVRAEYRFAEKNEYTYSAPGLAGVVNQRDVDDVQFFTRGSIAFDARTPTEWGTLRSFIRINAESGAPSTGTYLDQGFIQFAGLTAGRITSFFSFFGGNLMTANFGLTDPSVDVLAYTATFGSGFSATISVEDGTRRRTTNTTAPNNLVSAFGGGVNYGGQEFPDLVANLNVTQAWGSAQIMGALHQLRHDSPAGAAAGIDDEMGFAVGAGLNVLLPMIAAGDALWLQATYTEGALQYANAPLVGDNFRLATRDGLIFNRQINKTEAWSLVAAFRHYWTPTIWQDIQGAYGEVDQPQAVALVGPQFAENGVDYTWWQLGTRLNWRPVSGLTFSADVSYTEIDTENAIIINNITAAPALTSDEASNWAGRLRIQRDF